MTVLRIFGLLLAPLLFALAVPTATQGQQWKLTEAPNAGWGGWASIACSADAETLVAANGFGPIYTSTNAGVTWRATDAPSTNWRSVACSADGAKIAAITGSKIASLYRSTNSGATWLATGLPDGYRNSIVLSAEGARLLVTGSGLLLSSSDFGTTWKNYSIPEYTIRIAMSADGSWLVAEAQGPDSPVYVSTNSGATWTPTGATNDYPGGVAISADGTRMVAASYTFDIGGPVYTSRDSGTTWTTAEVTNDFWTSVSSSADGTTLAAVGWHAYVSVDSGRTWSLTDYYTDEVTYLASSADGCRLVAASYSKGIYIRETTPQPVLTITLVGDNVALSWIVPSQPFVLEQSPDFTTASWTDVTTPPVLNCSNLHHEVTLPAPVGPMFYRLKSQ